MDYLLYQTDDVFRHPADVEGWKHFDCTISSFLSSFKEIDAMFLEFNEDLNNTVDGSSSMGDNFLLKPLSPHVVPFSHAIGVCIRKTFPVCYLRWADVGRKYIKVVKGDVQHELAEQQGELIDRVELFRQTHVRESIAGTSVLAYSKRSLAIVWGLDM
ncbi:CACTA en-spm transposon protein [Cucumis melo var. makuwa]|uniref:CACTA en-spm transposon protein n=1 Tax=Cucumis melo var. makuwa TaxID=1194695 RepID=A0A5A7VJY9_CUCMM|nr:CACTA en-spm transposon protein [Cucumis melo var. makuwa]TYK22438.1 CACTA en-spm transposon protein [Cucumis melo var. makuwa]